MKLIEETKINQPQDREKIDFEANKNYQVENGNRRPWLNFILVNLSLKKIFVIARADKKSRDDEDLQLRIDGQRQVNDTPKSHRYWYWCGKILRGQTKLLKKEVRLARGIHYLEFLADRQPFIEQIVFELEKFGRQSTVDDPNWTGDFNDDSEQMLLARAIFGEARGASETAKTAVAWSIRNRLESKRWGDTYHEVILKLKQYSAFNVDDKNYLFVIDPLRANNHIDKEAWILSYKLAGQVINDSIPDPTDGANHYYSGLRVPPWAKSKQADFKIKIDNFRFYYLGPNRKRSRKSTVIIAIAAIATAYTLNGIMLRHLDHLKYGAAPEALATVSSEPFLLENEVARTNSDGKSLSTEYLTDDGYMKTQLKLSPDGSKLGYVRDGYKSGDEIDDKEYFNNQFILKIMDIANGNQKEVYRGDYHTSNWEWVDNYKAKVYRSCGNECMTWRIIDINSGEQLGEGQVYD